MSDNHSHTDRPEPSPARFAPDAFAGTASYYSQYRLPYPDTLLDHLLERTRPTGKGTLIDLACGPGRLSIPLAPNFARVVAVDQEAEMIAQARAEAGRREIRNVRWRVARAESLRAGAQTAELVSIGEAFHRLDQKLIADRARRWLKPGCCIAIVGQTHPWQGKDRWHRAVRDAIHHWKSRASEHTSPSEPARGPFPFEDVLNEAGFAEVESFEFFVPHAWTIDELIGFFYSTSLLSRRVLGDFVPAFEYDLRRRLLEVDDRGIYSEDVGFGYVFGRRHR